MRNIKLWSITIIATLLISCSQKNQQVDVANTKTNQLNNGIAIVPEEVAKELPPSCPNFEWKFYHNAVFRAPIGWNEKETTNNINGFQSFLYATSPEKFSSEKYFEMGITVNVFSGGNDSKGLDAHKIAALYLAPTFKSHKKEEIIILETNDINKDEKTITFRYSDHAEGQKPIIVHKFIIANKKSDSVYVFIFESPENNWEENWKKYGTPFLEKVTTATIE